MNTNYLDIKEIQKEETNLLKIFAEYLMNNNIDYSIYYGTLLGAIRHNGFIPWDDDIDVAILRKEYNRLLYCLKRDNGIIDKDLKIEAIGYELGNSVCPYIKIINKNIEILDDYDYDHFIWIDVFPLDNIPENNTLYFKGLDVYRRIYYCKRDRRHYNSVIKNILMNLIDIIDFKWFLKKYINYCKKYENKNTNYIAKNVWARKTPCIKEKFVTEEGYFDNVKVRIVKDYDYFLKVLYGDNYMQLPPEEKRVTHLFKARYVEGEVNNEKI